MVEVVRSVGRLLEVTVRSPVELEEVLLGFAHVRRAFEACGGKLVGYVDCLGLEELPGDADDWLPRLLARDNEMLECAAFLLPAPTNLLGERARRILERAEHADRRVFGSAAALEGWLGLFLDAAELARLQTLLADLAGAPTERVLPEWDAQIDGEVVSSAPPAHGALSRHVVERGADGEVRGWREEPPRRALGGTSQDAVSTCAAPGVVVAVTIAQAAHLPAEMWQLHPLRSTLSQGLRTALDTWFAASPDTRLDLLVVDGDA